ncbi:riboflavin synthase [soil metagenome]
MFTGIVEELGAVRSLKPGRLEIACREVLEGTRVGDSISVNGCCLTVTRLDDGGFSADLMGETLARTALGDLDPGAACNLERALRADARLGGHLVQGHVDAVADVAGVKAQTAGAGEHGGKVMTFTLPPPVAAYVVEKGSITVDGTSLTVMSVAAQSFTVGLIPHTLEVTVLGRRGPGDRVNLEADVIAKYVERLVAGGVSSPYLGRESRSPPSDSHDPGGGVAKHRPQMTENPR